MLIYTNKRIAARSHKWEYRDKSHFLFVATKVSRASTAASAIAPRGKIRNQNLKQLYDMSMTFRVTTGISTFASANKSMCIGTIYTISTKTRNIVKK